VTDASSAASTVTVVLVHGAFADASSWNGVIERLQAAHVPVLAVGHSYGGAVISNGATGADNVVGLVYVAAFSPDEGETLQEVEGTSRDSALAEILRQSDYPVGSGAETAVELSIDPAGFHHAFAGDLPEAQAALMAASQRPVAAAAFGEKSGPPAWKTLPSWAVVATGDKAAGADVVRSMAQRANASITEIEGSHVIMISQPAAVTAVILRALESVAKA
jgi:pimeloyl-ACP methyl ester carboxylesterase